MWHALSIAFVETHLGGSGLGRLKRVLSVLIATLEAQPSLGLATQGVEASYRCALEGWGEGGRGERGEGGADVKTAHHTDHADEFDVIKSGFFTNSSLAPILRVRRRFRRASGRKGLRMPGSLPYGMGGLMLHVWDQPVPLRLFEPRTNWIPPDLRGFFKWVMDARDLLNRFVLDVVHRSFRLGPTGFGKISRPIRTSGLGLTLLLRLRTLCASPGDLPHGSGILVQPALIDAHFRKAWMLDFRREGHPAVTLEFFFFWILWATAFLTKASWIYAHSHGGGAP